LQDNSAHVKTFVVKFYNFGLKCCIKNDKEKAELFAERLSEVFSPHDNDQDQEVEQDLATPIQLQERLKAFTLKEIKYEIKMLNQKKAPGLDLITARMLKELPKEGLINLIYILNAIL
jgi:hypothetical protein